jgi:hypothetical protein
MHTSGLFCIVYRVSYRIVSYRTGIEMHSLNRTLYDKPNVQSIATSTCRVKVCSNEGIYRTVDGQYPFFFTMKKKGGGDKLTLNNDFYEEVVQ